MRWAAVGWDANDTKYYLTDEGESVNEVGKAATYRDIGLAWNVAYQALKDSWAPFQPGLGDEPEPPAIVRAKPEKVP